MTLPAVSAKSRERLIADALLRWYRASHRDLPWRRTRDPYAIWVSEIMLQQTRVEVVVAYYQRFVERFPTPQVLAAAPLDDVLFAWSGLGYYRRARQLHEAATQVVRNHGGVVPSGERELRALPGVGRYTAGAIRSIAFGKAAPIVDGNVARVLSRVFALKGAPGEAEFESRLWELAARLVPASDPSAFNQGLMELGATVCLPRAPRCTTCPLEKTCRAHALGQEEAFPPAKPRKAAESCSLVAWIVRDARGRVLMRKRGEKEQNAGFWEPALTESEPPAPLAGTAVRNGEFRHAILHRTYAIEVRSGLAAGTKAPRGFAWIDDRPSRERPFTTVARKAFELA